MDPESCLRSIRVCESSSGSVLVTDDVKGETSDSVSKHVLVEQNETKPQQGKGSDSRTGKDGVGCCNVSAHAVHEVEKDTYSTHGSGSVTGEIDALTKGKVEEFHVVDLSSCGGERDDDVQSICRICHFGSDDQTPDRVSGKRVSLELIEIGCKCKNELGLAHLHCAEAWFKLRGNSVCEICGCTAKNVTVSLTEEEWSEAVVVDTRLDERRRSSRQSCSILLVLMLIIILLHWFFKKFSGHYKNK
ncbi:hypothetical protein Bca52824_010616 [Brassica carinata]|uniref:RING-CH-type domain-containing protein n=1 Tax=Brassica carinata TaxID=52824 RepID=A0A8X7WBT0_BRACI|nr:hypothetical protein Bca52824_010616 [Brassica carinata]